jgi:hypothetical protein
MGVFALFPLLLGACSGSDVDSGVIDADRDGFTAAIDCDDSDPEVHPGALEICEDGLDNDCEGGDADCGTYADLPVAPSADRFMVQGRQTDFLNAAGEDCSASIVAAVSDQVACYVDASGALLCAGTLYEVEYGPSFASTSLEDVSQVLLFPVMEEVDGNSACAVVGGHPSCMGFNNYFGALGSGSPQPVAFWTEWDADVSGVTMMATGSASQSCLIDGDGQGWCTGEGFGVAPAVESLGPHESVYVDSAAGVYFDLPLVWRASQGSSKCTVQADGLHCGETLLGRAGHVVDGGYIREQDTAPVLWLEDDGKVYRFDRLWDESTVTTQIFTDVSTLALLYTFNTDTICAVTNTGAMHCVGSNQRGKLGLGDEEPLLEETEVLGAGTFDLRCHD